ncbi:hypothetical protein CTA1_5273 [Colletotrichum tanaceti]|uniref:Uncharacterized protein n=1 Tax=Colletotrichum tanaceti TaxID=1306861 RepID=A0A4U6XMX9_9PEZI|nr:hypothetical protein CTA1_5273 [Colletotrichum tanaceti]
MKSPAQNVEPAPARVLDGAVKDPLADGLAPRVPVLGEEAIHGLRLGLELRADVHGHGGDWRPWC